MLSEPNTFCFVCTHHRKKDKSLYTPGRFRLYISKRNCSHISNNWGIYCNGYYWVETKQTLLDSRFFS